MVIIDDIKAKKIFKKLYKSFKKVQGVQKLCFKEIKYNKKKKLYQADLYVKAIFVNKGVLKERFFGICNEKFKDSYIDVDSEIKQGVNVYLSGVVYIDP